jgi:hypothetical protein
MEKYTTPELEVVMFETEDVIRTSDANEGMSSSNVIGEGGDSED